MGKEDICSKSGGWGFRINSSSEQESLGLIIFYLKIFNKNLILSSVQLVTFCIVQLLLPLAVQINKRVQEIWNASTDIEEVDDSIIKVEVNVIWHIQRIRSFHSKIKLAKYRKKKIKSLKCINTWLWAW